MSAFVKAVPIQTFSPHTVKDDPSLRRRPEKTGRCDIQAEQSTGYGCSCSDREERNLI